MRWTGIECPALLVTAAVPLGDGRGFVVAPADEARFLEAVPDAAVKSVDANHFGILADPATSEAIRRFSTGDGVTQEAPSPLVSFYASASPPSPVRSRRSQGSTRVPGR